MSAAGIRWMRRTGLSTAIGCHSLLKRSSDESLAEDDPTCLELLDCEHGACQQE